MKKPLYIILTLSLSSQVFANPLMCHTLFNGQIGEKSKAQNLKAATKIEPHRLEAIESGMRINEFFKAAGKQILERENVLKSLLLSMIAKEHLLLVGPPGNAKTTLTKLIFENIKEKDTDKESFFATQMTAETSLSDTHGGIDYKVLQDTGRQQRLYEEGILGARLAMLDEQFDMRPNGYRNILDVLAERSHAQSGKKHKGLTWTVVGASNTFIPEVYAKFDGNDQPRALIDRYSFVMFIPAEMEKVSSHRSIIQGAQRKREALPKIYFEDFEAVQKLVSEVEIPDYVADMLSLLQYRLRTIFEAKEEASLQEYKEKIQAGERPLAPYKSTKYMSPRTLGKAAGILRANIAIDYATNKGQRKLVAQVKDLESLIDFYSLGGPDEKFIETQMSRASKEVEKDQLRTILYERKAVRDTLKTLTDEFNQKITELGTQDLYTAVRQYADMQPGQKRELMDTLRAIYSKKAEIKQMNEQDLTAEMIAELSLADLVEKWVMFIEPSKGTQIINSWSKNAPVTKNKNTGNRYEVSQEAKGSFNFMSSITEGWNKVKTEAVEIAEDVAEQVRLIKPSEEKVGVVEPADPVELKPTVKKEYNDEATNELKQIYNDLNSISIQDLKAILDKGADPNVITNINNWTTLSYLSVLGRLDAVQLLLDYGADPLIESIGYSDRATYNALTAAEKSSQKAVAELIRKHIEKKSSESAATQNAPAQFSNVKENKYNVEVTEELKKSSLLQMSLDDLRIKLNNGGDPNTVVGGWTMINYFSYHGKADYVKLLLESDADPLRESGGQGYNALTIARTQSYPEIVEMIERHLAQKNKVSTATRVIDEVATAEFYKNDNYHPHKHLSRISEYLTELQAFLDKGVDVNRRNVHNWTYLNAAAFYGQKNVVEFFLKNGGNPYERTSNNSVNLNALEWAEKRNHTEIVKILKDYMAQNPNPNP